jgi:hypothetical protein
LQLISGVAIVTFLPDPEDPMLITPNEIGGKEYRKFTTPSGLNTSSTYLLFNPFRVVFFAERPLPSGFARGDEY